MLQQFLMNYFSEDYVTSRHTNVYCTVVSINDHPYELQIHDLPEIPSFTVNYYYERKDYNSYGLRSANAYILVFDLTRLETFQYVQTIRQQIVSNGDNRKCSILFVGNKQDLQRTVNGYESSSRIEVQNMAWIPDRRNEERRRDIVEIVENHLQCGYVQCSAMYNRQVKAVFMELMRSIHASRPEEPCFKVSIPVTDHKKGIHINKCNIM